jgi:hypothetical protein
MFAMDLPPNVPAQSTPVVMAMASHNKKATAKTDHTIGICHLIENRPDARYSAVNSLSPVLAVWGYLERQGQLPPEQLTVEVYKAAKLSVLQHPKHGTLGDEFEGSSSYDPTALDYRGPDRATFLVEVAGRKVKVRYFFNVMQSTPPAWKDTIHIKTRSCARRARAGYGKSLLIKLINRQKIYLPPTQNAGVFKPPSTQPSSERENGMRPLSAIPGLHGTSTSCTS